MNQAKSPIFCLDGFEVINPPKDERGNLSNPLFQVKLVTKEKEYWVSATLFNLLQSCKVHAPAEYRYIEQLQWYVANGGQINFHLLQAMEDEGFQVERLMTAHFENEDWQQDILPPGMELASIQAEAINGDGRFAEFRESMVKFLFSGTIEKISSVNIAQAFQEEVWRTYPALQELHQRELARFIKEVAFVAETFLTDDASAYEDYLQHGDVLLPGNLDAEYTFSPEGIRQGILEDRLRRNPKPDNAQPIQVEVVEVEYLWLDSPDNNVRVWYKAICGGGEFHDFVPFKYLIDEAALKFPEIYGRIVELREQLVAVRPKEREIVEALQKEGVDWLPLLESYVNGWVDASEKLDFDRRIKEKGNYKNRYEMHLTDIRTYDEKGLQEVHEMTLLSDRLEDIGYRVLSDIFPDMIRHAKPWMLQSLRQGIHLLVFETMDKVAQLQTMAAQVGDGCE